MSLELPTPIAAFIDANARLDPVDMLRPFAADAYILDNGKRFDGHAGIRRLIDEAVLPAKAVFTPDTVRRDGDEVVAEGLAHGDFPGSPLRFTYRFTLKNDAIQALDISL